MADYPDLGTNPDLEGFSEEAAIDPTIRSEMESGHQVTRSRFTRVPKKWVFKYTQLPNEKKEALQAFEASVGYGSGAFNWVHPISSVTHVVRFSKLIKYKANRSNNSEWDTEIEVMEI